MRKLLAKLSAAGEVVMRQLIRYEGSKTIEARQRRVSLCCALALAGRRRLAGLYVSRALGSARVAPTAAIDGLPEAEPKSSGVTA